jgi:hypothetical protein
MGLFKEKDTEIELGRRMMKTPDDNYKYIPNSVHTYYNDCIMIMTFSVWHVINELA